MSNFPYETHSDIGVPGGPSVPCTGKVTGEEQGYFRNGKRTGPWASYDYFTGRIYQKVTYKNGKKDGPEVLYHDNGQISWKGTWKDGVKISD